VSGAGAQRGARADVLDQRTLNRTLLLRQGLLEHRVAWVPSP
jgi:hypothetical protein